MNVYSMEGEPAKLTAALKGQPPETDSWLQILVPLL